MARGDAGPVDPSSVCRPSFPLASAVCSSCPRILAVSVSRWRPGARDPVRTRDTVRPDQGVLPHERRRGIAVAPIRLVSRVPTGSLMPGRREATQCHIRRSLMKLRWMSALLVVALVGWVGAVSAQQAPAPAAPAPAAPAQAPMAEKTLEGKVKTVDQAKKQVTLEDGT